MKKATSKYFKTFCSNIARNENSNKNMNHLSHRKRSLLFDHLSQDEQINNATTYRASQLFILLLLLLQEKWYIQERSAISF